MHIPTSAEGPQLGVLSWVSSAGCPQLGFLSWVSSAGCPQPDHPQAWPGPARPGLAWPGQARPGQARLQRISLGPGLARQWGLGMCKQLEKCLPRRLLQPGGFKIRTWKNGIEPMKSRPAQLLTKVVRVWLREWWLGTHTHFLRGPQPRPKEFLWVFFRVCSPCVLCSFSLGPRSPKNFFGYHWGWSSMDYMPFFHVRVLKSHGCNNLRGRHFTSCLHIPKVQLGVLSWVSSAGCP